MYKKFLIVMFALVCICFNSQVVNAQASTSGSPAPLASVVPIDMPNYGQIFGDGQPNTIAASAKNDIWLGGYSLSLHNPRAGYKAVVAHYDGVQWKQVLITDGEQLFEIKRIAVVSLNNAWLAATSREGRLVLEHWDGVSWKKVEYAPSEPAPIHSINISDIIARGNEVWLYGNYYYRDDEGHVLLAPVVEHYNGWKWYRIQRNLHTVLKSLTVINYNDIWGVGDNQTFHYDGWQWHQISHTPFSWVDSISASSPNNLWVVGSNNDSLIWTARWESGKWQKKDTSQLPKAFSNSFHQMIALATNNVWASGVYYTVSPGIPPHPNYEAHYFIAHWDGKIWSNVTDQTSLKSVFRWQRIGSTQNIVGMGSIEGANTSIFLLTR